MPLARALFAVDSVLGKGLAQPLADQLLHGPVGHRHQVHVALVFGVHALGEKLAQPRARLARNCQLLWEPRSASALLQEVQFFGERAFHRS